jgi:hypothetical protein
LAKDLRELVDAGGIEANIALLSDDDPGVQAWADRDAVGGKYLLGGVSLWFAIGQHHAAAFSRFGRGFGA